MIEAKVILDSVSEAGKRLTTMELTMPRFVLAQWNTHRAFSRNAASSRAVPTAKLIEQVRGDPFIPAAFAANQRGMQAGEVLESPQQVGARIAWKQAAIEACLRAEQVSAFGVHKQWANRLLEPFLWVKVLVSATEWANFFRLRLHEDAQPEFQALAAAMKAAMDVSEPAERSVGQWHLPYIEGWEFYIAMQAGMAGRSAWVAENEERLKRWSVARCARLGLSSPEKDEELYERLLTGSGFGHWSPFEHVATPLEEWETFPSGQGNFKGWIQFRKQFENECAREKE
jgi:thymidylate synthase ThyX